VLALVQDPPPDAAPGQGVPLALLRKWTLCAAREHDLALLGAVFTLAAKAGHSLKSVVGDSATARWFVGELTSLLLESPDTPPRTGPASPTTRTPGGATESSADESADAVCVLPWVAALPLPPPLAAHLEKDPTVFVHLERYVGC
jgi:hypothetical protein